MNFGEKTILTKMETISIKKISGKDIEDLQIISTKTFSETFSAVNTEGNMKKYLEEQFSAETLSSEVNNPDSEFYFALNDGKPIGYLKLNFGKSQTEIKDDKSIEIERIYVLEEFQGKKVGQMLYEKGIQIARQQNMDYVWLGVWEENQKAIKFYKKNGFIQFDKHSFILGNDQQTDIMMKLELGE